MHLIDEKEKIEQSKHIYEPFLTVLTRLDTPKVFRVLAPFKCPCIKPINGPSTVDIFGVKGCQHS